MITSFTKDYNFLNTYYPINITYNGITYTCVESAYLLQQIDNNIQRKLLSTLTPNQILHKIKSCTKNSEFEGNKLTILKNLLAIKFKDKTLRKLLLNTNDAELVFLNTWNDTYLGKIKETNSQGVTEYTGENHLGKLLMELRSELSSKKKTNEIAIEISENNVDNSQQTETTEIDETQKKLKKK